MEKCLPGIKPSPILEKVRCGLSPEEVYAHFARIPETSLLNSSLETDAGRYSFLGIEPFLVLSGINNETGIHFNGYTFRKNGDPFECLRTVLAPYRTFNKTELPFISGGIGYFSYDLKNVLEDLPRKAKNDLNIPEIYFVLYRAIIIFDRSDPGHVLISALDMDHSSYKKASVLINEIKKALRSSPPVPGPDRPASGYEPSRPRFESNFTKAGYIRAIEKALEHIRAGDIYQACLSQRFKTEWPLTPYELYFKLNSINPAPFSAYLNFGDAPVISSSPELFLRRRGNSVETRPMKGTRPRGSTPEEDIMFKKELEKSRKDISELLMIVDLERNDLGKISVPGSVKVVEHRRIEPYPAVFQTIAVIKAEPVSGIDNIDIIKAAFPGGSISGCPKIRAMEILDELEPTARNVYTGAIGYISFHDTMDLNIAIRTMIVKGKDIYFQAGGGIVADSDPESEYEETLVKARALMESLSS
ncbi:MAG: aminodeoxychorismate synthase component I [Candidatus Omnitrophota bacterium]|nr:aminodeoxychorismate synthase component I [Candidatus Omnitrophota bacterium]